MVCQGEPGSSHITVLGDCDATGFGSPWCVAPTVRQHDYRRSFRMLPVFCVVLRANPRAPPACRTPVAGLESMTSRARALHCFCKAGIMRLGTSLLPVADGPALERPERPRFRCDSVPFGAIRCHSVPPSSSRVDLTPLSFDSANSLALAVVTNQTPFDTTFLAQQRTAKTIAAREPHAAGHINTVSERWLRRPIACWHHMPRLGLTSRSAATRCRGSCEARFLTPPDTFYHQLVG